MEKPEQKNEYFQKYLDEKFTQLNNKMDAAMNVFADKYSLLDKEVQEMQRVQQWQNQKIWLAMGALAVITITGGVFAGYFKTLNRQQVQDAVRQEVPVAIESALSEYGFKFEE